MTMSLQLSCVFIKPWTGGGVGGWGGERRERGGWGEREGAEARVRLENALF